MTDKHDDGGDAYPPSFGPAGEVAEGMSMWDAAALAALTGLCASGRSPVFDSMNGFSRTNAAHWAAAAADAFIAERRKRMERGHG